MPNIETVFQKIAWSYANLARAHAALEQGKNKYTRTHHIIRARLYSGLTKGNMNVRSLYDDEKLKMILPQNCSYCGNPERLSVDHLIPRSKGGEDKTENLVWACRSCNSSKNDQDMIVWMNKKGEFPSILILRRYLKVILVRCEELDLLENSLSSVRDLDLPFSIELLPTAFPPLHELRIWAGVANKQEHSCDD